MVKPALDMTTQWSASDTFDHKDRCEELEAQVEAIKELGRKDGAGVDVDGVNGVSQWSPGAYQLATDSCRNNSHEVLVQNVVQRKNSQGLLLAQQFDWLRSTHLFCGY